MLRSNRVKVTTGNGRLQGYGVLLSEDTDVAAVQFDGTGSRQSFHPTEVTPQDCGMCNLREGVWECDDCGQVLCEGCEGSHPDECGLSCDVQEYERDDGVEWPVY